jgi:hypothetical protein
VLGKIEKKLCHGSGISQDLKMKKEEKCHCHGTLFLLSRPSTKVLAKERNDHYRGLK